MDELTKIIKAAERLSCFDYFEAEINGWNIVYRKRDYNGNTSLEISKPQNEEGAADGNV